MVLLLQLLELMPWLVWCWMWMETLAELDDCGLLEEEGQEEQPSLEYFEYEHKDRGICDSDSPL